MNLSRALIYFLLAAIAVAISSSQGIMKHVALVYRGGSSITEWRFLFPFFLSLALSGIAQLVWLWTLQYVPLGQGFLVLALTFVFVPLIGWFWFQEPMAPRFAAGVALVVGGILLITIN